MVTEARLYLAISFLILLLPFGARGTDPDCLKCAEACDGDACGPSGKNDYLHGRIPPQAPSPKDFFGLHDNRGQPLEIVGELAEPEVNGVERYGGDKSWVLVRLGGTAIESRFLTVSYEQSLATAGVSAADLRKTGLAHILKLEASGDVVMTFQDQTLAGSKATFDLAANRIRFNGPVTLTQKQKVYLGSWLTANFTTGDFAITAPLGRELPRNRREGGYPPIYDIWGQPEPRDAR